MHHIAPPIRFIQAAGPTPMRHRWGKMHGAAVCEHEINRMDRRQFLMGTAAVSGVKSVTTAARDSGPNILLIIADDQGLDAGCYGGVVKTPNLDRLAAEGTLFTQGYASVSSCSPSRSVLYTGLFSHSNGMYG